MSLSKPLVFLSMYFLQVVVLALALVVSGTAVQAAEKNIDSLDPPRFDKASGFFKRGDQAVFLLGRNATGTSVEQFQKLIDWAAESGETILRIHLTHGMGMVKPKRNYDEQWMLAWEKVFDMAAKRNLQLLPVFSNWADWNDGSDGSRWHFWHRNPHNIINGGSAKLPEELFKDGVCQQDYLEWLKYLIGRWQSRQNIIAWEVFSELDLVTGSAQYPALQFMKRAASVVRNADPQRRPITASLSALQEWPALYASDAVDFIQVHPYANRADGHLDTLLLKVVRRRLRRYNKAVFIGESGFDARGAAKEMNVAENAPLGLENAIWAAAVSGAINGRMFWWEDGYDQYSKTNLSERVKHAASAVASFVKDIDYSGFKPINVRSSESLFGAVLGHNKQMVGWFRDKLFQGPSWPLRVLQAKTVSIKRASLQGHFQGQWQVDFIDTKTGLVFKSKIIQPVESKLQFTLPDFRGSIAFKLKAISN